MSNHEIVFLAIAVKNRLMAQDQATACLNEFNAQPAEGPRRGIGAIARERGFLNEEQAKLISAAAQKVAAGGSTPRSGTPAVRNPDEPIPGVKIARKLGTGGTATVFLAEAAAYGGAVALKIIHPTLAKDEKALGRFQREASLLVEFAHPNIVKGHAQGMLGPLAYFVMEFLEGETAQERLDREKAIPEPQALRIIQEAGKAIECMQSQGYVHRDIKPGNIMLLKDGRVKVLDLGFAQRVDGSGAGAEETTSGTAQYMSPEQARGQRDLDVRADIYSLGATLYHMVMGELPFAGTDSLEVMAKQVMEALNSSEIKNRRISRHMHYFIERMMSKDKDLRYATPHELIDDITEQIEGFQSLEYRPPGEGGRTSTIIRLMNDAGSGPEAASPKETTRGIRRPATGRASKIGGITRRFRKE
jgi:serine/threonine-protein kinase